MRKLVILEALGAGVLVVALMGCSSSKPTTAAPALTVETGSDWYGRATEAAFACQQSTKAVDDALDVVASSAERSASSVAVMLAAGQAVEDCTISTDSERLDTMFREMDAIYPEGTDLLRQWLAAAAQADRDALLVAATNLDSRQFVGALFEDQRRADEIADQLEHLVATEAERLGVAAPTGETLYHWNPPEH